MLLHSTSRQRNDFGDIGIGGKNGRQVIVALFTLSECVAKHCSKYFLTIGLDRGCVVVFANQEVKKNVWLSFSVDVLFVPSKRFLSRSSTQVV